MVCYAIANGSNNAVLNARGKHYVFFDKPADKGPTFKKAQPELGWCADSPEGYATLPFSVAARLILPLACERDGRDKGLFEEFPSAQLFDRLWTSVVGFVDLESDCIFQEVVDAAKKVEDKEVFYIKDGDWLPIQGNIDDVESSGLTRWVGCITRGDVFGPLPIGAPGIAAAEIFFYAGPYMLNALRDDESHFIAAATLIGMLFQSIEDETICDGPQLASEVAEGFMDTVWPSILMQVTSGPDDVSELGQRGGPRITDLQHRVAYREARISSTGDLARIVNRRLPKAMRRARVVPCLSLIFEGCINGAVIYDWLVDIASSLGLSCGRLIDDRAIIDIERHLLPLQRIIDTPAIASLQMHERARSVIDKIESTNLNAKGHSFASGSGDPSEAKTPASAKLLVAQMSTPDAIELVQELTEYRRASDYDPITYLEWAHSGRWPPEVRSAKQAAAQLLPDDARRAAVKDIVANDLKAPVYPLMQLAWGHVKVLEGYPELQDVHDLGQTLMPDVMARLCARAFSADGQSVPSYLRFARATKLSEAVRGRSWATDLDICSDGDACMLSFIEGGDGSEIDRLTKEAVYTDISQVLRIRRIGANLLAFFGVRDSATLSWRQLVSSCEHAFQAVPASDAVKRKRLGKAMQRFVTRALGDVGKRIDLVRYSAKHDAIGPRDLLPRERGGAADEFAEAVARIQDDQRRKRSAVSDDATTIVNVRLPSEAKSLALAAALEPQPKRQQQERSVSFEQPSSSLQPGVQQPASSGGAGYSPITLVEKGVRGKSITKFTIRVDTKAASRWLSDHGVKRACLGFQFGHASAQARRWASCPNQSSPGHVEAPEGPHAIVAGWSEAAPTFVHPADRHLLQSAQ